MRKRRGIDPMIAMVNVVFLLLAFFLMGQFQEPRPSGFVLPEVSNSNDDAAFANRLIIDADGQIEFNGLHGIEALKKVAATDRDFVISADAKLPAQKLISILSGLNIEGSVAYRLEVKS